MWNRLANLGNNERIIGTQQCQVNGKIGAILTIQKNLLGPW